MAKTSLLTGLRREEVTRLDRGSIEAIVATSNKSTPHAILLTHTKNGVQRKVLFPSSLILELQDYCASDRLRICMALGCKGNCGMTAPLFPSSRATSAHRCRPMSPQNLSQIIREAAGASGLLREKHFARTDGKPGTLGSVSDVSMHDLRHTYAVWTYLILRSQGDPNPWLYIQAQLGHRNSETTINTYLRMTRIFENSISETIVTYINKLTEAFAPGAEDDGSREDS